MSVPMHPVHPEAAMAPVLSRLVRLVGTVCLAACLAILGQGAIWSILAFTEVRAAGLGAVVDPTVATRVEVRPVSAAEAFLASAGAEGAALAATAAASPMSKVPFGGPADATLGAATTLATVVGVVSLLLLPAVLLLGFLVSVVRCPRSAAPCLSGFLWATVALTVALPWSSLWPEVAWDGLFRSYPDLVRSAEGAAGLAGIASHLLMPLAAAAMIALVSWRAGNALHADQLAAEYLQVEERVDREAGADAARGVVTSASRAGRGLAAMERAARRETVAVGAGADDDAPAPRRLI